MNPSRYLHGWFCGYCGHDNPDEASPCVDLTQCNQCLWPRGKPAPTTPGNKMADSSTLLWVCDRCRAPSPTDVNSCLECGAARPAICEYRKADPGPGAVPAKHVVIGLGLALASTLLLGLTVPHGWTIDVALALAFLANATRRKL